MAHTPALAARDGGAPRRSLLLAGGGIRVAYQAGVLLALEEAGLTFFHADGTSGGTMNLAMLLSGVGPAEACRRWRTLDVRSFASLPPLRRLLRGPPYPALGGSEGIRRRVLPHLGVDPARIRAARGMDGTFNVCDFAAKENLAVPHEEVDLDVLVAGISLPVLSPAVQWRGRALVDSVWIKDVNIAEAVRRGAEELWLVWCIGNHGVYRDGAFQQYVHMIEMSANGSLQEELAAVRAGNADRDTPIRLHVIRPEHPLPLDPALFLGRIDAGTLVAMGYRDAVRYLEARDDAGVALDGSATRMRDPVPGVALHERLGGDVAGRLEVDVTWEVDDLDAFLAGPEREGTLVGDASHAAIGDRRPARAGAFTIATGRVHGALAWSGHRLELRRSLRAWDRVTARLLSADGALLGEGRLERAGPPAWRGLQARGVGSAREGARAVARFWRWALTAHA